MKKLIVTRADENIKEMTNITHPILRKYAEKCGADFKIIKDNKGIHPHWRILQIYDMFNKYERIACIDSDTLILKTCPDIFDYVPYEAVGSIYEDKGTRQQDRKDRIAKVQNERGYVGWSDGYINTGICIFSDCHKELFNIPTKDLYLDLGFDDVLLKYMIERDKIPFLELPFKFNHMSMHSEEWNGFASRFDSYIIHYAGNGFFYGVKREDQIRGDFIVLNKYKLV